MQQTHQPTILVQGIALSDLITELREVVRSEVATIPQPLSPKQFLSIAEAAEFCGLAKQTLYSFTSAGTIPHIKRGGKLLFDRIELTEWLLQGKQITKEV